MENEPISIIDENAEFIVVNKPAGINFHDEDKLGEGLFNKIKAELAYDELFPVHRLDKMTSGLIIFAKTKQAAQQFQLLFNSHNIQKFYLAISAFKPKKKQGLIKGDMEKSRRGMWKLTRTLTNPATTQFFSFGVLQGLRLFILKPHSGKTHQIRVALNSIGAPIIGDTLYESKNDNQSKPADRGYLHAYSLSFRLNEKSYRYTLLPDIGSLFLHDEIRAKLTELGDPSLLDWPKI